MKKPRREWFAPRFSLRALLIAMLLAGPLCGIGWTKWQAWKEWKIQQEAQQLRDKQRDILAKQQAALVAQLQALLDAQAAVGGGTRALQGEELRRVKGILEGDLPTSEPTPEPAGMPEP